MEQPRVLTLRIPATLHARLGKVVEERKRTVSKFSMNDLMIEAVRYMLDGVDVEQPIQERVLVPDDDYQQRRMTADEIAARVPGVRRGL